MLFSYHLLSSCCKLNMRMYYSVWKTSLSCEFTIFILFVRNLNLRGMNKTLKVMHIQYEWKQELATIQIIFVSPQIYSLYQNQCSLFILSEVYYSDRLTQMKKKKNWWNPNKV